MKDKVASHAEPWYSTYTALQSTVASYGTISAGDYTLTAITHNNSGGWNEMRLAATKVYNLALMYTITGDATYAAGSRTIMMKYASIFTGVGTSGDTGSVYDTNLDVGVVTFKFSAAAELLRYGYSGWSAADTASLIAMFNKNTGGTAISMYQLLSMRRCLQPMIWITLPMVTQPFCGRVLWLTPYLPRIRRCIIW